MNYVRKRDIIYIYCYLIFVFKNSFGRPLRHCSNVFLLIIFPVKSIKSVLMKQIIHSIQSEHGFHKLPNWSG